MRAGGTEPVERVTEITELFFEIKVRLFFSKNVVGGGNVVEKRNVVVFAET